MKRLVQDQDGIYMIDEECLKKKEQIEREKEMRWQKNVKNKHNIQQKNESK